MSGPVSAAVFLATQAVLESIGVEVSHNFGGGAYIKTTRIPAGRMLMQHDHDHDHLSVLVSGSVRLYVDGVPRVIEGFGVLALEAHRMHAVEAITDAVWLCVWSTSDTDPETVDRSILKGV